MDLTPVRVSVDFRRLFIGRSISEFGDEVVAVAVPFMVYALTKSTLAVGLLGLCELVPVFVFPIVGGAVADSVERRRFMIWSHVFLALMSLAMAVNAVARAAEAVAAVRVRDAVGRACTRSTGRRCDTWPARLLPPELLARRPTRSTRGSAPRWACWVRCRPGILLAVIAPAGVFVVDAFTFLVAIAFVWRMAPSPPAHDAPDAGLGCDRRWVPVPEGQAGDPVGVPRRPQRDGVRLPRGAVPRRGRRVRRTVTAPRSWACLVAAPAAGAFLATAFSGRAKARAPAGRAILVAIVVWGAAIVVFGLSNVAVAVAADARDRRAPATW